MRLFDIRCEKSRDETVVSARVQPGGSDQPMEVWYRLRGLDTPPDRAGDALAVGLLVAAMLEGEPVLVEAPLSRRLRRNLLQAQTLLSSWHRYLSPVAVRGLPEPAANGEPGPAPGVACCFTAGVDSWYSLLKHRSRVTHLLLIRGFDIGLRNGPLWDATQDAVAGVAAELGVRLVTCETNLREIADKRRAGWGQAFEGDFWGESLHGAALASVGLLLSPAVGELVVPATHTEAQRKPWGSAPDLDPLWSNDRVAIRHDGCEAGRVDKIRALAASPLALRTLRVCYNDTRAYNCGRCEKCLRTMLGLRACRALDRATSFPEPLSLARVRRLIVPPHVMHRYHELALEAHRAGDREMLHAVEVAMGHRPSLAHGLAVLRERMRRTPVAQPARIAAGLVRRLLLPAGAAAGAGSERPGR